MPQFDISTFTSQLFWLSLVFGCLYIVVAKLIVPKAETILISRNRYLEDNIFFSEEAINKARDLRKLKERNFQELVIKSEKIRNDAMVAFEKFSLEKKDYLSRTLIQKTQESNLEIQRYIKSFHDKENNSCIDLASFIIEKITNKPADLELLEKIYINNKF